MAHNSINSIKARLELKKRMKHTKAMLALEFKCLMEAQSFDGLLGESIVSLLQRASKIQQELNATYSAVNERDLLDRSQKRTKKHGKLRP